MNTLEEKAECKTERKMNWIQRFFIICSGADKGILKQCPTEWTKYACIGGTILSTGVLASISGGYALYTVFRNGDLNSIDYSALIPAFLFGILWGLIIFNLDRFIVSTFRKMEIDIWWKRLGRELLQALPRILLAVIIAIVISKPIEIKIFETRLAEQIQQNEKNARERNKNDYTNLNSLRDKEQTIIDKQKKDSILQQKLTNDPQIVKKMIRYDLATANDELEKTKKNNEPKIKVNKRKIGDIENNPDNWDIKRDSLGLEIDRELKKDAESSRNSLNQENRRLQDAINEKNARVTEINNQINDERKKYIQQIQIEIDENQEAIKQAVATKDSTIIVIAIETAKADSTTARAFANNFIAQVEALGDLTDFRNKKDEEEKSKAKTMWWTSFMITLLFLTIELAPILTKLITSRGSYDEILERVEYEQLLKQKEIISLKNSEINELLRRAEEAAKLRGEVFIQSQKDKLDVELSTNKVILDSVAKKQEALALIALDKWFEAEKTKIDAANVKTKPVLENIRWQATNMQDAIYYTFNSNGELEYIENGKSETGTWSYLISDKEIEIKLPLITEKYSLKNFTTNELDLENGGHIIHLIRA